MEKYEEVLHHLEFVCELQKTLDSLTQTVSSFVEWLLGVEYICMEFDCIGPILMYGKIKCGISVFKRA